MVDNFMGALKKAKDTNPNKLPHVLDYVIPELSEFNAPADLQSGTFTVPIDWQDSSGIERLIYSVRHGEGVVIRGS
jgi:hypothetical protein